MNRQPDKEEEMVESAGQQEPREALAPDAERLTARQLAFVKAFTDPSDTKTLGNATRAAIAAGYSRKKARDRGYKLLRLPKIRGAIAKLNDETREMIVLDRSGFILRTLEQADAWKDEDGFPRAETHARKDGTLYEREARPSSAEVKALELAGRAAGHVGEDRTPGVQVNTFLIALPNKAATAEEWLEQHTRGTYGSGGRKIPASGGDAER